MSQSKSASILDARILLPAIGDAFRKLNPRSLARNPVMFVVAVVSALTTLLLLKDVTTGNPNVGFSFQIVLWLWFTVLLRILPRPSQKAEARHKQNSLRRTRTETQAKLLDSPEGPNWKSVPGTSLKVGDIVLVEANDIIPSDGEVIEGVASVNEAAITGNPRLSSVNPAATALPLQAEHKFCPTGSRCASPPHRAPPSSTR